MGEKALVTVEDIPRHSVLHSGIVFGIFSFLLELPHEHNTSQTNSIPIQPPHLPPLPILYILLMHIIRQFTTISVLRGDVEGGGSEGYVFCAAVEEGAAGDASFPRFTDQPQRIPVTISTAEARIDQ